MKTYDIIIVGGGAAGMTAALYSARNGLKVAVISTDIGGTSNSIPELENWPGFKGSGPQLMKQMYDQVKEYEVDFILKTVKNIAELKEGFAVVTEKEEFRTHALIIATGTERRKLNLPNEVKFIGKGISYCATCDGFFFRDRKVGVIGGSDCACVAALALSGVAKEVNVFYRGKSLKCEKINLERMSQKKNINIHYEAVPSKIIGKEQVEGLEVDEKGKKKEYELDGIFIEIGAIPITELLKKLNIKLNEAKHIIVDESMNTSVMGVFAAGDVTNQPLKQVIVAAGQGAIAAKSAYDYLTRAGKI